MQQDFSFPEFTNSSTELEVASKGQRFANYLIDVAAFYLGCFMLGIVLALAGKMSWLDELDALSSRLIGLGTLLFYYIVLESATGRTLGKLFTRTKVVMQDGSEPSTGAIMLRSLCRIIPFDALSFLGGTDMGWHDRISKTKVVKIDR